MSISKEDVIYVAKLAKISLGDGNKDQEIDTLAKEMANIVKFVEKINEVETDSVEPLANVLDLVNVHRDDENEPSLPLETIEKLAPKYESGLIVVPAVIE